MVKDFTLNDVVAYLYDELDSTDTTGIKNELSVNDELSESYLVLNEAKKSLPSLSLTPSASVLNRILLYSSINGRAKCN